MIVGANGAGKTTWGRAHRAQLTRPFYNADVLADGLGDPNDRTLQTEAARLVAQRVRSDMKASRTFGFESTYSGRTRPEIVRRAHAMGYVTRAVFLGTCDPGLNIARVRKRTEEGGHHVETREIIRRWHAAWRNLLDTWTCFEAVLVLDTSGAAPAWVASKQGERTWHARALPQWAEAVRAQAPDAECGATV